MSFVLPTGDALVSYLKDWTGSSNDAEIKQCIYQAEMMMRNIELPSLRSDPYAPENIIQADEFSNISIPADMNKPILFFKQGNAPGGYPTNNGPWIVYDRIGDRDIIAQSLLSQIYLQPVNVPSVIRGKFSEVGNKYKLLPLVAQGDNINMYYYRAWQLLFTPVYDSAGVQVDTIQQNGVLTSFPEGYVYASLHCYYVKRHSTEDAQVYLAKFEDAFKRVEDQNNLGKWSGGHTKQYSMFQPRRSRQYNIK